MGNDTVTLSAVTVAILGYAVLVATGIGLGLIFSAFAAKRKAEKRLQDKEHRDVLEKQARENKEMLNSVADRVEKSNEKIVNELRLIFTQHGKQDTHS